MQYLVKDIMCDHICEVILNLDQGLRISCPFKVYSIFSSGGHFVQIISGENLFVQF